MHAASGQGAVIFRHQPRRKDEGRWRERHRIATDVHTITHAWNSGRRLITAPHSKHAGDMLSKLHLSLVRGCRFPSTCSAAGGVTLFGVP